MKISVVIPAYNEESFLPIVLASLRKQTFSHPFEIIVVDNNSTDNTANIAKKYGARVVFERKRGYAHACNAGFASAKGEIIARADADYLQPKDWLEKIDKAFEKDTDLIALGGPTYPLESKFWENLVYYPTIVLWMYTLKLLGRGFLFPNMAVRTSVYKKCGGFNTDLAFGEDVDICLRLKKMGKIRFILSIYNYSSVRRLCSLGFYDYVIKYTIGNQLLVWLGKKVTVGLDPIRVIPQKVPKKHNPWLFLYSGPALLFVLLTLFSTVFIPPAATQQVMKKTRNMAKLSDEMIQKRIQLIKKNFSWDAFFYTSPVKEI